MIKNFNKLATDKKKEIVLKVLESGLEGSLPKNFISKFLKKDQIKVGNCTTNLQKYDRIFVIGIGKAADSMAFEVNSLTKIDGGLLVIPEGNTYALKLKNFSVLYGGHPMPNKNSLVAAQKIIKFLRSRAANDFVLFLISGGSSSLLVLPEGITLKDKKSVNGLLLKSGANIDEINCVRKHLSKIKGGKILENLPCDAMSLLMSDVVGDDITVIGSGLTSYDKTTFFDAKTILKKYKLLNLVPKGVLRRLDLGIRKRVPETPKKLKIKNYIVASNKNSLKFMAEKTHDLGLKTKIVFPIKGNVQQVAKILANKINSAQKNSCIIFGGEPTVVLKGTGKGGRNQELVLLILQNIKQSKQKIIVSSVGTDGRDGNTLASGAILDSHTKLKNVEKYLERNDSFHFLKNKNGLIFTGSTKTNLMDIGVLLKN